MALLSPPYLSSAINRFLNPNSNPNFPLSHCPNPLFFRYRRNLKLSASASSKSHHQNPNPPLPASGQPEPLRQLAAASAVLFLGLGISICSAAAASARIPPVPAANRPTVVEEQRIPDNDDMKGSRTMENLEDKDLKATFEKRKSRTYALTVPLRIVAIRGSIPPSWVQDFIQSQGRRAKLRLELRGSLDNIFSDLSKSFTEGNIGPKSAVAADIVSVGDSWLSLAIRKGLIVALQGVEDYDWFRGLDDKWKVYLRRNSEGRLDPKGTIWAAPYRWGSVVVAYKKNKFQKHNLAPIKDWADIWRPELAGKISMVDDPREVVGAVLKSMGASYNTSNVDSEVAGGRNAVRAKLAQLQKQVRLFDSVQYLKAFGVGDVWVTVGWSSDVLPAAKRMTNVAVVVPKSGASLWADLWAIPATSRFATNRIGGWNRGRSPLVHQWIEFCLQAARAMPFQQEVIPGASPSSLEKGAVEEPKELTKGKPNLDTNLIAGVPPTEILARCEFLEPLSDAAVDDYQWLISSMHKPRHGLVHRMGHSIVSMIQTMWSNAAKGNLMLPVFR
ncbi:uncharacterized protein LOC131332364 isoform X2 [Rhododendron vialii]|uniref:uncharacterized protein LOC131332364 isoform X2 n=1 Tax=Rhododendron vialii TaxID=182163 RepID=UPI00265DF99C|nr:uncharacterized protein LOC131332364 isoform X2 [Rhododendron vialii]